MARKPKLPKDLFTYHVWVLEQGDGEVLCGKTGWPIRAVSKGQLDADWTKDPDYTLCDDCKNDPRFPILELAGSAL